MGEPIKISARTVLVAACLLLILGGGYWAYSGYQQKQQADWLSVDASRKRAAAMPKIIATPTPNDNFGEVRIVLSLNVATLPIKPDEQDLNPKATYGSAGGGLPGGWTERLLDTEKYPSPPYPTKAQYRKLKGEVISRLNKARIRVAAEEGPDMPPGSNSLPILCVNRVLGVAHNASFLHLRIYTIQPVSPAARSTSGAGLSSIFGAEFDYYGVREKADTWEWTNAATLYAINQVCEVRVKYLEMYPQQKDGQQGQRR